MAGADVEGECDLDAAAADADVLAERDAATLADADALAGGTVALTDELAERATATLAAMLADGDAATLADTDALADDGTVALTDAATLADADAIIEGDTPGADADAVRAALADAVVEGDADARGGSPPQYSPRGPAQWPPGGAAKRGGVMRSRASS